MNAKTIANRVKLVDEPFVKRILMNKYRSSGIRFIDENFDKLGFDYCVNGFRQTIRTIRNSPEHRLAESFTVSVDKNNLSQFNNTSYAFIDEASRGVYLINGLSILQYIIENPYRIGESSHGCFIRISKFKILQMLQKEGGSAISYNKDYAKFLTD